MPGQRDIARRDIAPRRSPLVLALSAALALAALTAGCGGDDSSSTTGTTTEATTTTATTTTSTAQADGAAVFTEAGCGTCHVFAAAGSDGAVGPSLDASTKSVEEVEAQVRSGGGQMPPFEGQLSDEEIAAVAAYVVDNRTG